MADTDKTSKTGVDRWNEEAVPASKSTNSRAAERSKAQSKAKSAPKKAANKGGKDSKRYATTLLILAVLCIASIIAFMPPTERITQGLDIKGGVSVILTASNKDGSAVSGEDMATATSIIQNRVNSLGASEATVQRQGTNSILVQIPGATDAAAAVETIGRTGQLEFVKMGDIGDADALAAIASGQENIELKEGTYTAFMTGDSISTTMVGQQSTAARGYVVDVTLDAEGAEKFAEVTRELAPTKGQIAIVLDGKVDSAPAVQSEIPNGQVQISGNYTLNEAKALKTVLDSGSLPVNLSYSESRVVGPTLGQDSLNQAIMAIVIGLAIVVLYLFFFYRGLGLLTFGSLAVFALIYLGILAVLSHYGMFALSLPGIAGVVLTVGMAADSSILVLERFREEIRMGRTITNASMTGVKHGIETSLDADMVTLVSAIALFLIAVGPVKGFGMTLALGVICDIITMFLFKAPALRLLARGPIQKNPGFWGVKSDLEAAGKIEPAQTVKGGVANA
ncbi:MAG: protein translocase subunit SecD [Atopobiaceae bacterium]|nr:protein translocase subunit SecD [Atopobiaceae bacterium]